MTNKSALSLAAVALLAFAAQRGLAEVDMGIMKDAQADMEAGKSAECLAKVSKLLAHTSSFERTTERGRLLVMRGECLLQQKQTDKALEAFAAAAESFPAKDNRELVIANATAELIKKCTDLQYIPRTGEDKKPLPVSDIKTRGAVFQAVFRDEFSERQEAFKTLQKSAPLLASIEDFAEKLRDLSSFEIAATGQDAQTKELQTQFAEVARRSMDVNVGLMTRQAESIQAESIKSITISTGPNKGTRPRGITVGEKNVLSGMVTSAKKVTALANSLTSTLGLDGEYFKKQIEDATGLQGRAETTLRNAKVH